MERDCLCFKHFCVNRTLDVDSIIRDYNSINHFINIYTYLKKLREFHTKKLKIFIFITVILNFLFIN